ncbi:unnamed protein product [Cyprideis torosa]|uniref:Uncharacterized protein n=1 Tax=Cyprideis torosa TaxID=163714 RepID=A0A7R8W9R1_9CRUS|nr:unnamed protein product [Cyprideis torosa]CAG0884574.1 unnamed protein product [Cyprideis torosa]
MPSKKQKFNSKFPPARIKRIMQTDEDVGKVATPVPVIISRAVELFLDSFLAKAGEGARSSMAKTLVPNHIITLYEEGTEKQNRAPPKGFEETQNPGAASPVSTPGAEPQSSPPAPPPISCLFASHRVPLVVDGFPPKLHRDMERSGAGLVRAGVERCFRLGAEIGRHENHHAYKIKDTGTFSIFKENESWTAQEEIKLLDGVEQYQYGNWTDVAKVVETRTPEECKLHFNKWYVQGNLGQLVWSRCNNDSRLYDHTTTHDGGPLSPSLTGKLDPIDIDESESAQLGYMANRDDYENEYHNDSELLVSQIQESVFANYNGSSGPPSPGDTELDSALKIAHVDMYMRRLRDRNRLKRIARDYQLIKRFFHPPPATKKENTKIPYSQRSKFQKEEKELHDRFQKFSQFMSAAESDVLMHNVKKEYELKIRIRELIRYRKQGIRHALDAVEYEASKHRKNLQKKEKKNATQSHRSDGPKLTVCIPSGLDVVMTSGYQSRLTNEDFVEGPFLVPMSLDTNPPIRGMCENVTLYPKREKPQDHVLLSCEEMTEVDLNAVDSLSPALSNKTGSVPTGSVASNWLCGVSNLALDTLPRSFQLLDSGEHLMILSISDVVIYRTTAERGLDDLLFTFLHEASQSYSRHFRKTLEKAGFRGRSKSEGKRMSTDEENDRPNVIIFHESLRTDVLKDTLMEAPGPAPSYPLEHQLRVEGRDFTIKDLHLGSLKYVGVRASDPKKFDQLSELVEKLISTATPRSPKEIYRELELLTDKFSFPLDVQMRNKDWSAATSRLFDDVLTCPEVCRACGQRCARSRNHEEHDGEEHDCPETCQYSEELDNRILTCKYCHESGRGEVKVVPKAVSSQDSKLIGMARYFWSGSVLECPHCGEIYRFWQHWIGNQNPVGVHVLHTILHVWKENHTVGGTENAAQYILDSFTSVAETLGSFGKPPTKMASKWLANCIAPSYWRPDDEIIECHNPNCRVVFAAGEDKHHCRSCGEGFCSKCSSKSRPVPEKGWGTESVRVCDSCHKKDENIPEADDIEVSQVRVRKLAESVKSTFDTLTTALVKTPIGVIKDQAHPLYWVPDSKCFECVRCKVPFSPVTLLHHCRNCGQGVCDDCSKKRMPVPERGWDDPVRICDGCFALRNPKP